MRRILYAFLVYTILGLLSGFYYRELTLAYDFTGETQLVVVSSLRISIFETTGWIEEVELLM